MNNLHFWYTVQKRNSGPKTPTSLHEKRTGWCQWALSFCVDVDMQLTPSLACMRPPEPDPSPLGVDVINGWPLTSLCHRLRTKMVTLLLYPGPWIGTVRVQPR